MFSILLIVISIPACYNYSLYKYAPEYTFEEDHRPTFECKTNILETACNVIIGKVEKNRYAIAGVLFELDIIHSQVFKFRYSYLRRITEVDLSVSLLISLSFSEII